MTSITKDIPNHEITYDPCEVKFIDTFPSEVMTGKVFLTGVGEKIQSEKEQFALMV